jgi:hypothetical protein
VGFVIGLPEKLTQDDEFILDLCRFAEGILTEKQVRKKYHLFSEEEWTALNDDALVERIELEKVRRVRSGATKRELAQLHVIRGPAVLATIMDDPKANAKHRVDSIKALDDLATPEASRFDDRDFISIRIDLTADTRAKGQESNPADVLVFDKSIRPDPPYDGKVIDATPAQTQAIPNEPPPVHRGRGRPRGSKNRPKTVDAEELLPFDGGGSDEPL